MMIDTAGEIVGGQLRIRGERPLRAVLASWPDGPVRVRIETGHVFRNAEQNRYWHVLVQAIAEHLHLAHRQVHEALKVLLLPEVVTVIDLAGAEQVITIGGSTATLTRHEAANLISRARVFADQIGAPFTAPPTDEPITHFVPLASRVRSAQGHPQRRAAAQRHALCGALVDVDAHEDEPVCAACRAALHPEDPPA